MNAVNRHSDLLKAAQTKFDLLVIGGGITGAGIALDAALRGLKVLLLEKQDFASGTSSRSTKLIHGGLRYLKQMEIGLVAEVGRERNIVYRNARNLVRPEKMILPILRGGSLGYWATSFGLWLYDYLAEVPGEYKRQMATRERIVSEEPNLRHERLLGGGIYTEYRTDDARLTISVLKTAFRSGAKAFNYVSVEGLLKTETGEVRGAICRDLLSDFAFDISATHVVNATGPWVDQLRSLDGSLTGKTLHLTKGVHIVVPHDRLPLRNSVYFDLQDGRMMFAIPREGVTYLGTTDTNYQGGREQPEANRADVEYILNGANQMFSEACLTKADVISSWTGLRPLIHEEGKSPSELSRKDEILVSPGGLISIAGGKLTGYRKMAEHVVDRVMKLRKTKVRSVTSGQVLAGAEFHSEADLAAYKGEVARRMKMGAERGNLVDYLVHRYGKNTDLILDAANSISESDILMAEIEYVIHQESCVTLCDYFIRRSGKLFFDPDKIAAQRAAVSARMSEVLGWGPGDLIAQNEALDREYELCVGFLKR